MGAATAADTSGPDVPAAADCRSPGGGGPAGSGRRTAGRHGPSRACSGAAPGLEGATEAVRPRRTPARRGCRPAAWAGGGCAAPPAAGWRGSAPRTGRSCRAVTAAAGSTTSTGVELQALRLPGVEQDDRPRQVRLRARGDPVEPRRPASGAGRAGRSPRAGPRPASARRRPRPPPSARSSAARAPTARDPRRAHGARRCEVRVARRAAPRPRLP